MASDYPHHKTKKAFTTEHLEKALTAVFVKSICDRAYRELCLSDPRAAVAVVAPDLDLPADFQFEFVDRQEDVFYSYLLPPLLEEGTGTVEFAAKILMQDASAKTHPPTDVDTAGNGQGNPGGNPPPTP